MKILYAIQGTGNGHISRARDIIPLLRQKGDLDVLISGTEAEVALDYPVKFVLKGLSLVFGKKGSIDLGATFKRINIRHLIKEINDLPVHDYDIIINDFEPVSAWACRLHRKPCIALSHQAAVVHKHSPRAGNFYPFGKMILKNYAPCTVQYGFHFEQYSKKIYTPVIRNEVRNIATLSGDHYTVYLPAYSDQRISEVIGKIENVEWHVFSKRSKKSYREGNITVLPISNDLFVKSMASSRGILCGAGFETPAESLFLHKKLMVIPMNGQYEQQYNAASLKSMGIPVLKKLDTGYLEEIRLWINSDSVVPVHFPDITAKIIDEIFEQCAMASEQFHVTFDTNPSSYKKIKQRMIGNILNHSLE
ncbi:MAG TPA: glycosyltransferase family protein [Ginsengibacter sp.]|nr:glycosyltransferase family protein [Ginsengibacter sp.]